MLTEKVPGTFMDLWVKPSILYCIQKGLSLHRHQCNFSLPWGWFKTLSPEHSICITLIKSGHERQAFEFRLVCRRNPFLLLISEAERQVAVATGGPTSTLGWLGRTMPAHTILAKINLGDRRVSMHSLKSEHRINTFLLFLGNKMILDWNQTFKWKPWVFWKITQFMLQKNQA